MSMIKIVPLGFAAGAQVVGVDLSKPLSDADQRRINEAWLEHIVLVFPEQKLTPEEQIDFSRRFGVLDSHESQAPSTLHREILVLSNKIVGGKKSGTYNSGRNWHTDLSYTTRLAKGAILHCKEKPPVGGDTMWANLTLALETLTPPIRRLIEDLEALHDVTLVRGIEQRDPTVVAEMKKRNPPVIHPVVRTHPRPAASRCWSTSASAASSACRTRRARTCSPCSTRMQPRPSSSTGTAGAWATW